MNFQPLENGFNPHRSLAALLCSGECTEADATLLTWRKGKLVRIPDWGTVVIGRDRIAPEFEAEVSSLWEGSSFLFDAPTHFIMAHIVAGLGAFPSASRARKDNWNKPVPPGVAHWQVKIDGCLGEVMTINVLGTDWEAE